MRTLLAKILLAQVLAVVLALLVVLVLTRVSLNRGFIDFIERQEAAVLSQLAPALGELHGARGGWQFLRENPGRWDRILRRARPGHPGPPPAGEGRPFGRGPGPGPGPDGLAEATSFGRELRWLGGFDRLALRERLFLLDEQRRYLAGARIAHVEGLPLEPVLSGEATVGWVGFVPVRAGLPPEVQRFLRGQLRVVLLALGVALLLAAGLGYLLARHISRPLRRLDATVGELSRGHYEQRAQVVTADEIGRLADHVNRLAEILQQNRTARRRWMADIAHELRTPVSVLKGEVEALADGLRRPDPEAFASLGEEIEQLSTLVSDLQALALADAGALELQQERLDLVDLLRQVGEGYRQRLAERDIVLELQVPERQRLSADPQRLRQLFQNLLENCVRYADAGGRVRISVERQAETVRVTVEDSGPGVDAAHRARLFERFYRAEESRSRAGGGSGLGLAISRSIVEAHGGAITAGPSALGGLAIQIELPEGRG